jgi:glucose-6-phosphate dehydrogenase assembly protein OpcA
VSTRVGTRGEALSIAQIGAALRHEWGQLSTEVEQRTGMPPLRASTCTLVIVAHSSTDSRRSRETLHQLASAVPSRVLLFLLDDAAETASAHVWAHCTLTSRGHQGACYDVIEVTVPPRLAEAIPNIVAVNRLGQLPTFLFWNGQVDLASPEFRAIARVADRLVIDSERSDAPLRALSDYAMYLGTEGATIRGSDLAWTRLSTWRELIAQSFDPPNTRRYAGQISNIEMTYDESHAAGAILLASWISSRLGFRPESASDSPTTLQMRARSRGERSIEINLHHSQGRGVGIRAVRILARTGTSVARITLRREDEMRTVARIESTGIVHHLEVPRHELLAAELMRYERDKIYEDALAHGAEYCRLVGSNSS